jgi:hypothetical protein
VHLADLLKGNFAHKIFENCSRNSLLLRFKYLITEHVCSQLSLFCLHVQIRWSHSSSNYAEDEVAFPDVSRRPQVQTPTR